ncbi:hypothetical protein BDW62DRAFT_182807 [Aspergillus aurantiobrunneus]
MTFRSLAKKSRFWRPASPSNVHGKILMKCLFLVIHSVGPRAFASCLWRCQSSNYTGVNQGPFPDAFACSFEPGQSASTSDIPLDDHRVPRWLVAAAFKCIPRSPLQIEC